MRNYIFIKILYLYFLEKIPHLDYLEWSFIFLKTNILILCRFGFCFMSTSLFKTFLVPFIFLSKLSEFKLNMFFISYQCCIKPHSLKAFSYAPVTYVLMFICQVSIHISEHIIQQQRPDQISCPKEAWSVKSATVFAKRVPRLCLRCFKGDYDLLLWKFDKGDVSFFDVQNIQTGVDIPT